MKHFFVIALFFSALFSLFGANPTKTGVTPYVKSLSISAASSVGVGSSAKFTCYAVYSDGRKVKISPKWSSSKSSVATVSSAGSVKGKKVGSATIKATASFTKNNGKKGKTKYSLSASKSVKVVKALKSISISGASSISWGKSAQYKCYAVYSDGSKVSVTPSWSRVQYYNWPTTLTTLSSKGVLKYKNIAINKSVTVVLKAKYKNLTATKTIKLVTTSSSSSSSGSSGYSISGPSKIAYGRTGTYYLYHKGKKVTSSSVKWTRSGLCTMQDKGSYGLLKATNRPAGSTNKVTVKFTYNGFTGSKSVTITR